jgi:hypothetical protein
MADIAEEVPANRTIWEQANEIMLMLEMANANGVRMERIGRSSDFGHSRKRGGNLQAMTQKL